MDCTDGETVFRHACKLGLQGIVSKRTNTTRSSATRVRHERDARTEGDGRRTWYDAAGVQLGRFDVAEGWRIIEEMRGARY